MLKSANRCCHFSINMKYRIEMSPLAGRYVVAFKDPESGDLVKTMALNKSAAGMLQMHLDGMDVESIARSLSEKYGVPCEQIAKDASILFDKLGLTAEP